jgi:hypothetical protein
MSRPRRNPLLARPSADACEFGRRLRGLLRRTHLAGLLEPRRERNGTLKKRGWTTGGCWLLAEALRRWIGPRAQMVVLTGGRAEDWSLHPEHVLVRVGGWYLDGLGARTRAEVLHWARRVILEDPEVVALDEDFYAWFEEGSTEDWGMEMMPEYIDLLHLEIERVLGPAGRYRWGSRCRSARRPPAARRRRP